MDKKVFTSTWKLIAIYFFVIFTAISINILLTLDITGPYIGIRICATDLIIPVIGIIFLYNCLYNRIYPEFKAKHGWALIIIISIWMIVGLINGYLYTGTIVKWALFNKFLGWYVLIFYLIIGMYIGNYELNLKILFFKLLIITTWIICIAELLIFWFYTHGYFYEYKFISLHHRVLGLYQNPNAFGIFLAVIYLILLHSIKNKLLFNKYSVITGSALLLTTIYFTYSRSAWLGLCVGCITAVYFDKKIIKYIIYTLFVACIFYISAYSQYTKNYNDKIIEYIYLDCKKIINEIQKVTVNLNNISENQNKIKKSDVGKNTIQKKEKSNVVKQKKNKIIRKKPNLISLKSRILTDNFSTRIFILKRSLGYFKESPLIGIGLGSYLWKSKNDGIPSNESTIHNSVNWLLVELGIIGLLIFSIFTFTCIRAILLEKNESNNPLLPTYTMISIIAVMLGASIGTEVLYQRYYWLLLGIFLVKNKN